MTLHFVCGVKNNNVLAYIIIAAVQALMCLKSVRVAAYPNASAICFGESAMKQLWEMLVQFCTHKMTF